MMSSDLTQQKIESFMDIDSIDLSKLNDIKLLIVDDCRVSSFYIKELLRNLSITSVDIAYSYQDAIALCKESKYNILILDHHLEQDINGSELYELLISKSYLPSYSSVITLSSDSTSQTVMNTLAKTRGSYLTKPTNPKLLSQKIKEAYSSYKILRSIFRLERSGDNEQAIKLAIKYSALNSYNVDVELYIINYYEQNKTIEQTIALCGKVAFANRANFICKKIELEYQQEIISPKDFIKNLSGLIKDFPNHIRAFDLLSDALIKSKNNVQAVDIAKKALKLTPAVKFRSLKLSRLSITTMDIEALELSGRLLAKNLTVSEFYWSSYVAEYLCNAEAFYQKATSQQVKKSLLALMKEFEKLASRKLLEKQKEQLKLIFMISKCRIDIFEGKAHAAKVKLSISLYDHMSDCSELNSVVLVDALVILYILGEFRLFILFFNTMKSRKQKSLYCIKQLDFFTKESGMVKAIATSSKQLNTASALLAKLEYKEALVIYTSIIEDSPYSTEACLGYLDCHIKLNIDIPKKLVPQIAAVSYIKLPSKQAKWRDQTLKSLSINKVMVDNEIAQPTCTLLTQVSVLKKLHKLLVFS